MGYILLSLGNVFLSLLYTRFFGMLLFSPGEILGNLSKQKDEVRGHPDERYCLRVELRLLVFVTRMG